MSEPRLLRTPDEVEPWLDTDRIWCAYALADLEEPFWSHAQFWATEAPAPAILLHLQLPSWNVMLTHGDVDAQQTILAALPVLPGETNLMIRTEALAAFEPWYTFGEIDHMLRLAVTPEQFKPVTVQGVERLHDHHELSAFYAGRAPGYDPAQVMRGVYMGIRGADGALLAVAGTHAASALVRIGVVGNVWTEPAARGQGLGRQVVSAVVATLFNEVGCDHVVLNVKAENGTAIRLYTELGFHTHTAFVETVAHRRR